MVMSVEGLMQLGKGRWSSISIDEALRLRNSKSGAGYRLKCVSCEGEVIPHRGSSTTKAHFEHVEAHSGCPKSVKSSGPVSRHPNALD